MGFSCASWSSTETPGRRGGGCQGSQHAWGVASHASALTRELRAWLQHRAVSTRMRLLQTHPYKRHFYRQENSLNAGGSPPVLRQEAQSHPGRYSNEGKRKQQKTQERKEKQASKEGRAGSGTGQEGLSTFSQEQSGLENQLWEDNLSA